MGRNVALEYLAKDIGSDEFKTAGEEPKRFIERRAVQDQSWGESG